MCCRAEGGGAGQTRARSSPLQHTGGTSAPCPRSISFQQQYPRLEGPDVYTQTHVHTRTGRRTQQPPTLHQRTPSAALPLDTEPKGPSRVPLRYSVTRQKFPSSKSRKPPLLGEETNARALLLRRPPRHLWAATCFLPAKTLLFLVPGGGWPLATHAKRHAHCSHFSVRL